jgi:ferric-dicitrate binding protein FerR (iron transport regulator)
MNSDNILTKVISGNANASEKTLVEDWISKSEANKIHFEELNAVWNQAGKISFEVKVDVNAAWERFNVAKETQSEKNPFIFIRIAAAMIILLISSATVFFFTKNETTQNQQTAKKIESPKKDLKKELLNDFKVIQANNTEIDSPKALITKKRKVDVQSQLIFEDSSTVKLNKKSELNVLKLTANESRIASLSGAGFFDIKGLNNDFILETKDLEIKAQGTKFNVNTEDSNGNFVEITVEDGLLVVSEKLNPSNKIMISSNQKYIFDTKTRTFTKIETTEVSKIKKLLQKLFRN